MAVVLSMQAHLVGFFSDADKPIPTMIRFDIFNIAVTIYMRGACFRLVNNSKEVSL